MHINPVFKKLIDVDKTRIEYKNFVNALLSIDWTGPGVTPGVKSLQYSPGIRFSNIEWMQDHPGFRKLLDTTEKIPDSIQLALDTSVPFFNYLESLLPGYRIIKAEMMATQPEPVDRLKELPRMHHDGKVYHRYSKRAQLAILTNPGAFLFVEDQQLNVRDDCFYEFNNRLCHWGVNWGDSLKLVLIVDFIEMKVWDSIPTLKKSMLFQEEETLDFYRTLKFMDEFRNKHRVVSPPGIEPGSTL